MKACSRIVDMSLIFPMCLEDEEMIGYLFFLYPLARAVWFGSDISIKIDCLVLESVKDWIHKWIEKPTLTQPET